MSSSILSERASRPTPVTFPAAPRLGPGLGSGSGPRPGATSRRSYYSEDRTQAVLFRSKGPESPSEFDPTNHGSNITSLTVTTGALYTHAILPPTASPDIVAATIPIEDLRHMEVIYDADRKRQFQALVRRYMNQLLHGCDREGVCAVPTCWTARKRLAGNGGTAGVGQGRKLTVLSARIMACTLASRDNPYESLCDGKPVEMGLAVKDNKLAELGKGKLKTPPWYEAKPSVMEGEVRSSAEEKDKKQVNAANRDNVNEGAKFRKSSEDTGAKDTKSFTQVLFDTRPLKLLEWLSIPPPITTFRMGSFLPVRGRGKELGEFEESKVENEIVHASESEPRLDMDELPIGPHLDLDGLLTPVSDENCHTHTLPPYSPDQIRSPTPSSPTVHKQRETLQETVTPAPHSSYRRAATSQDTPQTPIAPPPIHSPQRQHRRDKSVYESPRTNYHQSQFIEHFYGHPSPQQTPSRVPLGSSTQTDYNNPFGSLTPTDSSPSRSPEIDTGFLQDHLSIPPPQTLSHLNIGLILSLVKLCIDGETPSVKYAGADMFARQSVFYCLSWPSALIESFGSQKDADKDFPGGYDIDPLTTDKAFRIMAWKWENTVLKSLWKGLEEVYRYKPTNPTAVGNNVGGKSTPVPHKALGDDGTTEYRQHLLDDYTATYIIVMSMHALAAMLPREGSYLPRPYATEEEWFAMRAMRGRGLVTVDIGDCFENELAERLMKRVVRALDYRIKQAGKGRTKGNENIVVKLFTRYLRRCARAEMEAFKGEESVEDILGMKREKFAKNWSVSGCILEWARAVLLKDWDGDEVVKGGTVTAGALTLMKLLFENRKPLYLEPEVFACPLLADRLDPKDAPVHWYRSAIESKGTIEPQLTLTDPTESHSGPIESGKTFTDSIESDEALHLISHSFLFTPSTLVTYFRAINLSIMTKYYESALSTLSLLRQVSLNQCFEQTKSVRDKFIDEKLKLACTTYLLLGIRRQHILEDAFNAVYKREKRELMKPLKIKFLDSFEEGVDQGGPQIEFYDVLMKEIMGQDYGMFLDTDNVNHVSWFTINPLEQLHKFELLGVLMGIAVYNGITLPVNFPLIFYKKLLGGEAECLEDIEEGWPELVKGLRQLLDWEDGDVEDVFCRTYEFSYEKVDGSRGSVDMLKANKMGWRSLGDAENDISLIPNTSSPKMKGKENSEEETPSHPNTTLEDIWYTEPPMVTNSNRCAYVTDYLAWLTSFSVGPQFNALREGILSILPQPTLKSLFNPITLKSLFEGTPTISTHALESITKYDDGYHSNHPLIREFWSVVHNYSDVQKRALLEFVTASDRLPGGGVGEPGSPGSFTFVIQRIGPSENLPTSMTCFGRLLLPEYEVGKDRVKEKLGKALENSRGFGII